MSEVPITEAIEQAASAWAESNRLEDESAYERQEAAGTDSPEPSMSDAPPEPVATDAEGQGELFPPPPTPPFDFEKAYEDLARTEQRATNKKRTWEACKRDTKDAREAYDEALEDLHNLFIRIDQERRNARGNLNATAAMGVAFAAVAEQQQNANEEGGENVSDLEQTIDEEQPKTPTEEPTPTDEAHKDPGAEGPRD